MCPYFSIEWRMIKAPEGHRYFDQMKDWMVLKVYDTRKQRDQDFEEIKKESDRNRFFEYRIPPNEREGRAE